ncbi:hypothetical protein BDR04DRAFT_365559 [Suillus decipiens]|nr:hypothetical protein BDR04DRAFT_365559 [Suillus decipiens]
MYLAVQHITIASSARPKIQAHNATDKVLTQDQISISIMLILAITTLNHGISSTNARLLYPQHPPLAYIHPSKMTLVSNDPSWWPTISSNMFLSYWIGSSCQLMMSRSHIGLRFRSCRCRCSDIRLGTDARTRD